ncbi:MAG: hypothetical protein WC612_00420 [Bdellovibrionales bacterium]|jgi:hypothetical protein
MKAKKTIAVIGSVLLATSCWLLQGCSQQSPQKKIEDQKQESFKQCMNVVMDKVGAYDIISTFNANEEIVGVRSNGESEIVKYFDLKDGSVTTTITRNPHSTGATEVVLKQHVGEAITPDEKSLMNSTKLCRQKAYDMP